MLSGGGMGLGGISRGWAVKFEIVIKAEREKGKETLQEFGEKYRKMRRNIEHMQASGHMPLVPIRWILQALGSGQAVEVTRPLPDPRQLELPLVTVIGEAPARRVPLGWGKSDLCYSDRTLWPERHRQCNGANCDCECHIITVRHLTNARVLPRLPGTAFPCSR